MYRYFFLAALCLTPLAARAQDPKVCAALSEDKARLECYDLVHRKTANVTNSSKWSVREEQSKIDDSRNVFLQVASIEPVVNQYRQSEPAFLTITCRQKTTDLFISFAGHFMSDLNGSGRVTTRVDKLPAKAISMRESNDHKALGLWDGGSSIPFIKTLLTGDVLYVRAVPYSASAVEIEFPISGIADAIKPLREACKW